MPMDEVGAGRGALRHRRRGAEREAALDHCRSSRLSMICVRSVWVRPDDDAKRSTKPERRPAIPVKPCPQA